MYSNNRDEEVRLLKKLWTSQPVPCPKCGKAQLELLHKKAKKSDCDLNRQTEFKVVEKDGVLGFYDTLTPLYASFYEDDHTFSLMWTEYTDDFLQFHQAYLENQVQFGRNHGVLCQPQIPPPANAYTVSCVPWINFSHFAVHSYENKPYYFPSVEAGKFAQEAGHILMPLSITCHHATTDGYHIKCFLNSLQEDINDFAKYL